MFSGYRVLGSDIVESSWGIMPSIFMFSQHLHLFVFEVMFCKAMNLQNDR